MSTLAATFFDHAARLPEKPALWCEGATMPYRDLADQVSRYVLVLSERGVACGDHMAVILPNCVECVSLFLAAAYLGVALVPLSPELPPTALAAACSAADVKHVVGASETFHHLDQAGWKAPGGVKLSLDASSVGIASLPRLAHEMVVRPLRRSNAGDDLPYILTMTSGSTGAPKAIVLTQRNKLNRAQAASVMYGVTSGDRVLAATPLYHSLAERLVLMPLLLGGTSVLLARFSPSRWLECIQQQHVTFTIAVSSQLRQISELMDARQLDSIKSLRCLVSSSALLEEEVKCRLLSCLSCEFHECYGTSEIAIASNLDPVGAKTRLASVGRPAPDVDVRILAEDGTAVATNSPGEIACRTPLLFGGYYKRPDLTAAAMAGDYFKTGDMGRLDEQGYLYFLGRKKDIIISGGINIYPSDIESVIMQSGTVEECAAFPCPDAGLGEVVAVALVMKDGCTFDPRAMRFLCARELADFQQPRRYVVVESLPRNAMGKLTKHVLAAKCAGMQESVQA